MAVPMVSLVVSAMKIDTLLPFLFFAHQLSLTKKVSSINKSYPIFQKGTDIKESSNFNFNLGL